MLSNLDREYTVGKLSSVQMDRNDPSQQDGPAHGQEEQQGNLEIVSNTVAF